MAPFFRRLIISGVLVGLRYAMPADQGINFGAKEAEANLGPARA